jgi:hypothetical protein
MCKVATVLKVICNYCGRVFFLYATGILIHFLLCVNINKCCTCIFRPVPLKVKLFLICPSFPGSSRWLVLYLDVMKELVRLCDPESDVCGSWSPWQVWPSIWGRRGKTRLKWDQLVCSETWGGTPTTGLALRKVSSLSRGLNMLQKAQWKSKHILIHLRF